MSKSRDLADLPAGSGDINIDSGTLFVDASTNRVGVGTASPSANLEIDETTDANCSVFVRARGGNNKEASLFFLTRDGGGATKGSVLFHDGTGLGFSPTTASSGEAMRIDSSGNLLVGGTDIFPGNSDTNTGAAITANGNAAFSCDDNRSLFNRNNSDGDIIDIRRDGSLVGRIGKNSTGTYLAGTSGIVFSSFNTLPASSGGASIDNNKSLGSSANRWVDVWAVDGSINTSDRNEKQDIEDLTEAEQRVAVATKSLMRKFRWKSAVEKKDNNPDSDETARIHFGIIAQDLQAAFEAEGLDAGRYAMFIHSEWWETYTDVPAVEAQDAVYETQTDDEGNETQVLVSEAVEAKEAYTRTDTYDTEEEAPEGAVKKSRMGVRYSELLAFIIAAI